MAKISDKEPLVFLHRLPVEDPDLRRELAESARQPRAGHEEAEVFRHFDPGVGDRIHRHFDRRHAGGELDGFTQGGIFIYLAVYAIAGAPEAHRFLKLSRVAKERSDAIARNVAWDMMHWVNLDFHYHYAKYPSTVVCTSDQALADFLLIRKNLGPRIGREGMLDAQFVSSYGDLNLSKLSRLDGTTLGDKIMQHLLAFWQRLGEDRSNEIWFGPFGTQ